MSRTLKLDEDVEAKLDREARKRGTAPDALANEVLRRELETSVTSSDLPFQITGPFVRSRAGFSFDNVEKLLDEVESPTRK